MTEPLPLTGADMDRLARILGMLGSDHDGERAAAAMRADAMLRERGISWAELVDRVRVAQPSDATFEARAGSHIPHRQDARECLAAAVAWSERERDFLTNMSWKRRAPTEAQAVWLADLVERARSAREAA